MGWLGKALGAMLWLGVGLAPAFSAQISAEARQRAKWVLQSGDHRGRPFAIVDKKAASLYVFATTAQDNRASLGCVVVPASFYNKVVRRLLGHSRGVVYVLPERFRLTATHGLN